MTEWRSYGDVPDISGSRRRSPRLKNTGAQNWATYQPRPPGVTTSPPHSRAVPCLRGTRRRASQPAPGLAGLRPHQPTWPAPGRSHDAPSPETMTHRVTSRPAPRQRIPPLARVSRSRRWAQKPNVTLRACGRFRDWSSDCLKRGKNPVISTTYGDSLCTNPRAQQSTHAISHPLTLRDCSTFQ